MANSPGIIIPEVLPERQQQQRPDARKNLFAKILSDPRIMQFLLSFGANLSQPRQFGTSELQGFSQATLSGFQGLELQRAAQVARQQQEAEARRQSVQDRNAAIARQANVERVRGQTAGEVATTEETLLSSETAARDQPNVERRSDLAVQQAEQDLTKGSADIEAVQASTSFDKARTAKIPFEIEVEKRKLAVEEKKLENLITSGAEQRDINRMKAVTEQLRVRILGLQVEEGITGDLTAAGKRIADAYNKDIQGSNIRPEADIFQIGGTTEESMSIFLETKARSLDASASKHARDIISQGLGLDIKDLKLLKGFVGGMENTGQQENGKPVLVGNRSISGQPNPSGGWTFIPLPHTSGRKIPAMRLETEGAIIYILLANVEASIEANPIAVPISAPPAGIP